VVRDSNFLRAPIVARDVLHAAFGFPILLGGEVLGVMEFFSHEIRQPDQDLLDMMATIGSQIGQFIERKQAEDALHHTQAELAHVTRVATHGEMTASIAHEINQPLAAVVNNATACLHWLAAQNLEEARQSAEFVIADGHRAGEIIGRIRALATKAPSRKDWVDVNETIREVIALARSEVDSNGVSLRTRLGDDMPLILGDRIQLQQVILNLLINAIEAMSGISEAPRELSISSASDDSHGGRVVCVVDDDASLRRSLRNLLMSVGFRVETFQSAEAFLDSVHRENTGCLVLDLRMTGMNGLDLLRHLAARGSRIPVIILTAHGDDETRQRSLQAGAVAFLTKPFP